MIELLINTQQTSFLILITCYLIMSTFETDKLSVWFIAAVTSIGGVSLMTVVIIALYRIWV